MCVNENHRSNWSEQVNVPRVFLRSDNEKKFKKITFYKRVEAYNMVNEKF